MNSETERNLKDLSTLLPKIVAASDKPQHMWKAFNGLYRFFDFKFIEAEGNLETQGGHFRGRLKAVKQSDQGNEEELFFVNMFYEKDGKWYSKPGTIEPSISIRHSDYVIQTTSREIVFKNITTKESIVLHVDGDQLDVSLIDA